MLLFVASAGLAGSKRSGQTGPIARATWQCRSLSVCRYLLAICIKANMCLLPSDETKKKKKKKKKYIVLLCPTHTHIARKQIMSKAPEQPEGSAGHAVSPAAWDSLTDAQKMAAAGEDAGGIGGGPIVVAKRVGGTKARGGGEVAAATQTRDEGFWAFVWRKLVEWLCGLTWR